MNFKITLVNGKLLKRESSDMIHLLSELKEEGVQNEIQRAEAYIPDGPELNGNDIQLLAYVDLRVD